MASNVLRGTGLCVLETEGQHYDSVRGFRETGTFKSIIPGNALALANQYIAEGITCDYEVRGGVGTVRVDDTTGEFTLDVWEIEAVEERKDLFSHPFILQILNPDGIAALRAAIINIQNSDTSSGSTPHLSQTITGIFEGATANPLLQGPSGSPQVLLLENFTALYLAGTTDYLEYRYVVKHTTNVPNRWNTNIADFGIAQIYTPAQLLSELTNAALWNFPLPGRLQYKLSSILAVPPPVAIDPQNWLWGAMKSASTEHTDAHNRVNIITNYTIAYWSLAETGAYGIYPAFGGATPDYSFPI